ncbi:hypothetical protein CsSME_00031912 [Camellia sinensis var. sinensis]
MGKGSKSGGCKSASHQIFKDRAKNRVDDLQGMFTDLQSARKESRTIDVAVLEEQVHQMLREWKSELNEPSPASSLQGGSLGSFSSDIYRLLQLCEEEDDATSALAAPKPEPDAPKVGDSTRFQEGFLLSWTTMHMIYIKTSSRTSSLILTVLLFCTKRKLCIILVFCQTFALHLLLSWDQNVHFGIVPGLLKDWIIAVVFMQHLH